MPSVNNMWTISAKAIGKAGASFTPSWAKPCLRHCLCINTHGLTHTMHNRSHIISTTKKRLKSVVINKLSTLSTGYIIMIMNLYNKRRIDK